MVVAGVGEASEQSSSATDPCVLLLCVWLIYTPSVPDESLCDALSSGDKVSFYGRERCWRVVADGGRACRVLPY